MHADRCLPDSHLWLIREVLSARGQALEPGTRRFMERCFGWSLDRVEIHTGALAARSARAIGARAYAIGRHLVFDEGVYAPQSGAGRRVLAHELSHLLQQGLPAQIDLDNLTLGAADDPQECQAERIADVVAGGDRLSARRARATRSTISVLLRAAPETGGAVIRRLPSRPGETGGSSPPPASPPPGVCGPNVTAQVVAIWTKMQTDFRGWTAAQRDDACTRVLIPLRAPVWTPGGDAKQFLRSMADINGWDVLPLFQGASAWLRSYPIYDPASGGPCATPTSSNPSAPAFDDAHEDPMTCSNSVQVGDQCWLNGTVNYGTYGIMVRLCRDDSPIKFALALTMAETLIKTYKSIGPHPEDPTLPLAWLRATYYGGPSGKPTNPGNRPQCKCSCPKDGSVVKWDYVWEPVKPRTSAISPTPPAKPATPPPPPVAPSSASSKTYTVVAGDSLSKIAQKVYGNPGLWQKIYAANQAAIGPNPNLIKPGQTLTIP